ncbi:MAG: class I SAM-dependent methyltransferase [Nanoarchaeota archaeon]
MNKQQTKMTEVLNDFWYEARTDLVRKLLRKYKKENGKLLDAGCGDGCVTKGLPKSLKADGMDIYKEETKHSFNIFYHHDIQKKLPKLKDTYDTILCSDTLEHLPNDKAALKNIFYMLKTSGIAIIMVPAYEWAFGEHDRALQHRRRYSEKTLKRLISPHQPLLFSYWGRFLVPGLAIYKLSSKESVTFNPLITKIAYKALIYDNDKIVNNQKLHYGSSLVCVLQKK